MAKILIEEIVIFVFLLQIVSMVVFPMNIFGGYYTNQRWNTTTNSLEIYTPDASPSILSNTFEYNQTVAKYGNLSNNSATDPGNLINPLGIVASVGFYISMITDVLQGNFLYAILSIFIGPVWASTMVVIFNIMAVIVLIHVITGRLRWS